MHESKLAGSDLAAGACKYLLIMLLQRLEGSQVGLIDELSPGVAGDCAAIQSSGKLVRRFGVSREGMTGQSCLREKHT